MKFLSALLFVALIAFLVVPVHGYTWSPVGASGEQGWHAYLTVNSSTQNWATDQQISSPFIGTLGSGYYSASGLSGSCDYWARYSVGSAKNVTFDVTIDWNVNKTGSYDTEGNLTYILSNFRMQNLTYIPTYPTTAYVMFELQPKDTCYLGNMYGWGKSDYPDSMGSDPYTRFIDSFWIGGPLRCVASNNASVILPSLTLPVASFTCNNNWFGDPAPFGLECENTGYNGTSWIWTLTAPSGSTVESYEEDYEESILNTPGRYSLSLNATNSAGSDIEYCIDCYLILGNTTVIPNVTPTINPNATPVPMIPTFNPTLQQIINRSEYRSTIEETLIGNITAPYLDFIDTWTESWIAWVDQLSIQLNWPIIKMTELLEDVLDHAKDSFDSQYSKASIFLYWIGAMFVVIPASVWVLINYKLLIEILKAFMET